jgi:hypothetical protein
MCCKHDTSATVAPEPPHAQDAVMRPGFSPLRPARTLRSGDAVVRASARRVAIVNRNHNGRLLQAGD